MLQICFFHIRFIIKCLYFWSNFFISCPIAPNTRFFLLFNCKWLINAILFHFIPNLSLISFLMNSFHTNFRRTYKNPQNFCGFLICLSYRALFTLQITTTRRTSLSYCPLYRALFTTVFITVFLLF